MRLFALQGQTLFASPISLPLNRGPTLTTPHLHRASSTPRSLRHTPSPGNQHPAPTKGALSCDTSKNCSALLILVLAASFVWAGACCCTAISPCSAAAWPPPTPPPHAQACTLLQTEILDLQRRGISTEDAALTARVTAQNVPRGALAGRHPRLRHAGRAARLPPWRRRHRDRQDRKFHLRRLRQRPAGRAAARHSLRS